jgi:hypothetical protein
MRYSKLVYLLFAVGLTSTLGCGTVFQTPSGPYMPVQTLLDVYNVDTGSERVDPVSAWTSGRVSDGGLTSDSYGTNTSYSGKSDSQGHLYVQDPVFDAYWDFIWEDQVTGAACYLQTVLSEYVQEGVIYQPDCHITVHTLEADNYSGSTEGDQVYTGGSDKLIGGQSLPPGYSIVSPSSELC